MVVLKEIIDAALNDDSEKFKELFSTPELTYEQKWKWLVEVIDYVNQPEVEDNEDQKESFSIFELVIKQNNINMVEAIFATPGLNNDNKFELFNRLVSERYTILSEAATEYNIEMVEFLVKQTQTLPYVQRFTILNNTIDVLNDLNDCYFIDDSDNNDFNRWTNIKLCNDIIQVIIKSCSDLNSIEKIQGFYPSYKEAPYDAFILAVRYNDISSIQELASLERLCTPAKEGSKDTALISAVRNNHIEAIEAILQIPFLSYSQKTELLDAKNEQDETALIVAMKNGNIILLLNMLLSLETEQEIIFIRKAIRFAQEANMDEAIVMLEAKALLYDYKQKLVASDLSPDYIYSVLKEINLKQQTVLMQAVIANDVQMVLKILDHMKKLPVDQRFELLVSNFVLIEKDSDSFMLQLLLNSCSDLSAEQRIKGFYTKELKEMLILSARFGYEEIISVALAFEDLTSEFIINFLNEIDENVGLEDTVLIEASRNGNVGVVSLVFKSFAFTIEQKNTLLSRCNAQGETPLIVATCNDHIEIVRELCNQYPENFGFAFHIFLSIDRSGKTAWMHMVENKNTDLYFIFSNYLGEQLNYAISNKDTFLLQELFNILDVSTKFSLLFEVCIEDRGSLLMNGVLANDLPLIESMLSALSLQEKFMLIVKDYGCKNAIAIAKEKNNEEIIKYLIHDLECSLVIKNQSNETFLLYISRINNVPILRAIFNSINIINEDNEKRLFYFIKLLLQYNAYGQSAYVCALENENIEMAEIILEVFEKTVSDLIMNPFVEQAQKVDLVQKLLCSIPLETKFQVLDTPNEQSFTLPMTAVYLNYKAIVEEMFVSLTIDQVGVLINKKNSYGNSMLGIAQEQGFEPMVAFLKNISLRLAFNTHSGTVHDSVARSVIALSAHYLDLPFEDKIILKDWANNAPKEQSDSNKRDLMLQVINKEQTKIAFANLVERFELDINTWIEQLRVSDNSIQTAAARGLILIKENESYRNYLELKTQVSLMQILVLTWVAIQDERECDATLNIAMQLNDKKIALIDLLFDAQRDGNLTNGQDLEPSMVDKPKCQGGFVNNLMNLLIGLHSQVKVVVVNKETVKLKAMCLVGDLFNSADYDVEQVKEIASTLENDFCLTKYVQENLEPKIEEALHIEFDEFVETKFLAVQDISAITGAVLTFQSPNSYTAVQVIQGKLQTDLRMHPKPEEQPDDEQSEHTNKRSRLR